MIQLGEASLVLTGGVDVVADCPLYDIFPDNPPEVSDIGFTEMTGTIDIPVAGVYHLDGKPGQPILRGFHARHGN